MVENITISKLYVFGDSFATPYFCVDPENSFWGLAAKDLSVAEIYNYSFVGNCLDNIIHVILNENIDFENGHFLIGIPPLVRHSVYKDDQKSHKAVKFDLNFKSERFDPCSMNGVKSSEMFNYDKEVIASFSSEWNDTLNLEKIFLLDSWLRSKNAKFLILNLSIPIGYHEFWPPGKNIMNKIKQLDTCILFENTYHSTNVQDGIKPVDYSVYSWIGHHGLEGNANWYNKIIKSKFKELKWI